MIYLDNAATTLIKPSSVASAMFSAMMSAASPGRGAHIPAMNAANIVLKCREAAASLFNVQNPEQVIFTHNATHALNIAINSLAKKGSRVLISPFEHNSVTRPLTAIGADIIVAESPLFDQSAALNSFEEKIGMADLVVCTHASNVFGFVLPIYEIAELCVEHGVPLIVDASQSAGILNVDFGRLEAAFVAMPGHKGLFGPQGTGLLLCNNKGQILLSGGSGSDSRSQLMPDYLPDRHEAGTHNVPGIAGLLAGINYVLSIGTDKILADEFSLISKMASDLSGCSDIELFLGNEKNQIGVLSLRSAKIGCEELGQMLAEEGICVRTGLHCAPYAHKYAGTIDTGTVRVSVSPFTTLENAEDFSRILQNLLM